MRDLFARDLAQARDPKRTIDETTEPLEQPQHPRFALNRQATPTTQLRRDPIQRRAQVATQDLMRMLDHVGTSQ